MSIPNAQHLLDLIERKYMSFEEPNFSFVRKTISSQPYAPLLSKLKELFEVEEITDPNDDVAFIYAWPSQVASGNLSYLWLGDVQYSLGY